MTRLHQLYDEQGQSPWLDNLQRGFLSDGTLQRLVDAGVRGLTSNPTIFQKAMSGSTDYDDQFRALAKGGTTVLGAYWQMVTQDIVGALDVLAPVHRDSGGTDGFVSVEVAPDLARDTAGTLAAARSLHESIARPNLMVKIPGTAEGLPAIRQMIAERRSINVTLIFGIQRYGEVIEAYLSGLEEAEGDLSGVASVASFFISRVDTEVDRRLDEIGTPEAAELRGRAAIAQARLAYALFRDRFSGPRWEALAARGAQVQRPLWASTSTKDPAYPPTMYVDALIGPDTVNTLPDATIEEFLASGTVARTVDVDVEQAAADLAGLAELGVDLAEVSRVLEDAGVASFSTSFDDLIESLQSKSEALRRE